MRWRRRERLALQSDLAWVGQYNGAITGEVSERMVAAIKEFQKNRGGKQTGVLNPQERGVLAETARRRQDNVGWKIVTDAGTGVAARRPDQAGAAAVQRRQRHQMDFADRHHPDSAGAAQGSRPDHRETRRAGKEGARRRTVDYTVVKPDFFVLSGLQGLKKFYLRGTFKGDEVRILTILYDQATENTVEPVVIAMSSAFNPFPTARSGGAAAAQDRRIRHRRRRQRRRRDRRRPRGHRRLPGDRDRRALAMPIASPRTRSTTSRCCASMARAG